MAYESPAMSVLGTPLVHLPSSAPADASILQQAASQAQGQGPASRLRGENGRGGEAGGGGGRWGGGLYGDDDLGLSVE